MPRWRRPPGYGQFRLVEGGTDYGIKRVDLFTGRVDIVAKGLSLEGARVCLERLPPREAYDDVVHGIVWFGARYDEEIKHEEGALL